MFIEFLIMHGSEPHGGVLLAKYGGVLSTRSYMSDGTTSKGRSALKYRQGKYQVNYPDELIKLEVLMTQIHAE